MKTITKTAILRPVTVCVMVIILLAAGVLATTGMSVNLLPDMAMPMLGISVVYPGADADSVEREVTSVMENAVRTIAGIEKSQTYSYENVSVMLLTFAYGTDMKEKTDALEKLFATTVFPEGCTEPTFTTVDMNGSAVATVAVYNAEGDVDKLTADARALEKLFYGIEGVGSVSIVGAPERQIKIKSLAGFEPASLLIVQALSNENLDIPLGTIMADGSVVSIRNVSDAASLLDVMKLPAKLQLSSSVFSQFSAIKSGVKSFAAMTLQEFDDAASQADSAKSRMEEMDGMTADELESEQNDLSTLKSVMALLRANTAPELRFMWTSAIRPIVEDESFVTMTDDDLRQIADSRNISFDLLKWMRDGAQDGTLESDWNKLVRFRTLLPVADDNSDGAIDGNDLTYEQFAMLFRDGGSVGEETFEGLNVIHDVNCPDLPDCTHRHLTEEETADACKFADNVNTAAYSDIIETKREAETAHETAEITDEQYAALFFTATSSSDFALLASPSVIGMIRSENYEANKETLRQFKLEHVVNDISSPDYGKPVYKNGQLYQEDSDGNPINSNGARIASDGRLVNENGDYVDEQGNLIELTDELDRLYRYTLGDYVVFTDEELADLYGRLVLDNSLGITPSAGVVRLLRTTDFSNPVGEGDSAYVAVPLSSLGQIEFYENYDAYAQYNGLTSVVVEVYANADANTSALVRAVKSRMAQSGISGTAVLLDDKAQFINDSIQNVLSSILIGGALAIAVIYLFVRKIRSSLVVAITMPLSVLVALLLMWAMGITLNMVSLGGLAVGIGMLVDNSIVVLESITKRRDAGENVFDSCLHGTSEVAGSLFASTLTNVCVFFPMLFVRGLTREIFYDLVWAVIFSIVMSLIVAVTVIPSLYALLYRKGDKIKVENPEKAGETAEKPQEKQNKKSGKLLGKMESKYASALAKVLTKRGWVCLVALVLFAVSTLLVFSSGTEFMPSVDKGSIEVSIGFAAEDSLDDAFAATQQAASAIKALSTGGEVQHVAATTGVQGLLSTGISGLIRVQLDTALVDTGEFAQKIRSELEKFNFVSLSVTEMDGVVAEVTSGMAGMSATILGDDLDVLAEIAAKVRLKLLEIDNIVSVKDNSSQKVRQIGITIDKALCAEKGVDYAMAVSMLRVGIAGYDAASVTIDGETVTAHVTFDDSATQSLDSLLSVPVGFSDGGAVLLSDVLAQGGLTDEMVYNVICKSDGRYVTTLDVESYGTDDGTVSKKIAAAVKEVLSAPEYAGYEYEEGGVSSYLTDAFDGLVVSLIAAFLLLYGVMACQFESLVKPFIVIMSIPFAMTGGFLLLALTGTTLNVVSFVGLIMLMGVIVNGAIVMIDKIDSLIAEGKTPKEAVLEGCATRLRPILMTTLTTVLALVPIALGLGSGGELMQPMGIVVLGGLTLGTLVTLVLIPCFYCLVKRIRFCEKKPKKDKTNQNKIVKDEK